MSLDDVDRAIVSATEWVLAHQADDGHWDGNLSSDTTVTAWLAYGLHLWGDETAQDALDWLCRTRNPDGGWGGAAGEPSHRDVTQLVHSVLGACGREVQSAPAQVDDGEVLGMARVMRAFVRDDSALLSDRSPAMMRRLGYIGVLAPPLLARLPIVPDIYTSSSWFQPWLSQG